MKKYFLWFFSFVFCFVLILSSCKTNDVTSNPNNPSHESTNLKPTKTPQQLLKPMIMLENNVALWNKDNNAIKYEIDINGSFSFLEVNTTRKELNDGDTIRIRSIGDNIYFLTSEWSNTISYFNDSSEPAHIMSEIEILSDELKVKENIIYETSGIWLLNKNAEEYGNGILLDIYGNRINIYGLCSSVNSLTYDGNSYSFSNDKSYKSLNINTGSMINVGLIYNKAYKNFSGYFISKNNDPQDITIEDFNSTFDSNNVKTYKLTGMVYAFDLNGIFITDDFNTLYVSTELINNTFNIGDMIEVIGYGKIVGTLITFVPINANVISKEDINLLMYEKSVEEIINDNIGQKNNTKDHLMYRVEGTLIKENNIFSLYDGTKKLVFSDLLLDSDYQILSKFINKRIRISLVFKCWSLNDDFIVCPLNDNLSNIEDLGNLSEDIDINFLMINDTHGSFVDSDSGKSIGRVDSLLSGLEENNNDYIFIHNGDAFQGSYVCSKTYGYAMIDALNTMELDCFVLGNHEFDWGLDKIAAYKDNVLENGEANFPFLGANIYYKNTTIRPNWIEPYTIVEQDGKKVGIIGVMGKGHESSILTTHVKDYYFADPVSIVGDLSSKLRKEGCDVVVVATHDYDSNTNQQYANLESSSRIDAIFCAHTHQSINETVQRSDDKYIPVVQNYHKNLMAAEVVLTLDKSNDLISYKTNLYSMDSYDLSSRVQLVIDKYQDLIIQSNEIIGTTQSYLSREKLGNYAVDALLKNDYTKYSFEDIDVSIINTGGVRATISPGSITRAQIFEVFPFENAVVLVNISGKLIKSLIDKNSSYLYWNLKNEYTNYSDLDDNTIYQLAVIDYVFTNKYYTQFKNLEEGDYIQTDILLRDVLSEYIENNY